MSPKSSTYDHRFCSIGGISMSAPVASIVIPAYNNAATVGRALDSIAAAIAFHTALRTDDAFEIVIVDDGSTDATPNIVRDWVAKRGDAVLVRSRENRGVSHARNSGAARARAPVLFFLDADDDFLPPHLYCCLEALQGVPDAAFVRPNLTFDEDIHETWQAKLRYVVPSNLCVRKSCHDFVGGFLEHDDLRTYRVEDLLYAQLLTRYFGGILIDLVTVHHRSYPGNAFDRQLPKFRLPYGMGPDTRTEAEIRLQPSIDTLTAKRMAELDEQARRSPPDISPKVFCGVKAPIWHARGIGDWLSQRLKSADLPPYSAP
jgi:hypothetical protein